MSLAGRRQSRVVRLGGDAVWTRVAPVEWDSFVSWTSVIWLGERLSRLILTGVRPSGLRPNTGPNGPGTLVSPSGTDRKLLNGPGSDVN